ncbi:hypothetical protein B0T26DRAFT_290066 [Lasiosphaeria miniovina]|uniref:Uncharacterized protein n=1 Tax=Lasiosphaeria miniovina TaxID=1954250 RepID=A0AA40AJX9_9PEZI|nr:uncharacterized protein B0T26DRAFT_290066 [Lasiosphaeria miniovina]KAK0717227.1 hypothetical protein B0T26DRAFT_290066 [Lasiosphaeria miniovina]
MKWGTWHGWDTTYYTYIYTFGHIYTTHRVGFLLLLGYRVGLVIAPMNAGLIFFFHVVPFHWRPCSCWFSFIYIRLFTLPLFHQ